MKKYIRIMRIDHWVKQLFILPGVAFAVLLTGGLGENFYYRLIVGFFATCCIASANYVINEWLDAEFDKYHPVKKHRSVVENDVKGSVVYTIYGILTIAGLALSLLVSRNVFYVELWLWVMGILYNVKPIRTKDIPVVDVLSESVNNAIRLLIGWFIVTDLFLPPVSIVIGYWFGGAFLMDVKRFSEYRMIADKSTASLYRKSFKFYDERLLLCAACFYAMISSFFTGVFLVKYRVEFILLLPVMVGLFCYYLYISFKEDSAAQAPEKLYKEKGLMIFVVVFCILFFLLLQVDIPILHNLLSEELLTL
ncbi:MAG: UbiA prenyltransferase family protein [Butyrivibrio sp.]|uniref:UbiA prenyltransferase family protein n=1 Tax=Butyrivibrio sp. TaxID=28121 RepID=UPI001B74D952|nr:UbiA prenyltransferase family protein [Butyrivibrio sp.]MBP3279411.1 UbiA prenyltransferase family protein [Butyrivibrio sp.]MBP3784334.1 UbiA prenyltransferase family protein [Butyrivibrio sp.]MBP3814229.1 UbiA prenyltransferase family protein [Butyrivibrio sp.]